VPPYFTVSFLDNSLGRVDKVWVISGGELF